MLGSLSTRPVVKGTRKNLSSGTKENRLINPQYGNLTSDLKRSNLRKLEKKEK